MLGLVNFLIYLIVAGLVFYLLHWLLKQMPIPQPFKTVGLMILALVAVLFLLNLLFGIAPMPSLRFPG